MIADTVTGHMMKCGLHMSKCDFLCHDDVIIHPGEDDVIVDIGNVVACCHNDVILNDGQLKCSSQDEQFSLFRLPSINACSIHRGISTQHCLIKTTKSYHESPKQIVSITHLFCYAGLATWGSSRRLCDSHRETGYCECPIDRRHSVPAQNTNCPT